jgi:hypothetical protein
MSNMALCLNLQLSHFHSYDAFAEIRLFIFISWLIGLGNWQASNAGLPSKLIHYQLSHAAL